MAYTQNSSAEVGKRYLEDNPVYELAGFTSHFFIVCFFVFVFDLYSSPLINFAELSRKKVSPFACGSFIELDSVTFLLPLESGGHNSFA
jgi:hypothetical protein